MLAECCRRVQAQTYSGKLRHSIILDGPSLGGPHHDGGSFAINYGIERVSGDLAMQLADDEWIEPTLIEKLVDALLDADADFAQSHRRCANGGITRGTPEKWDLTTGLFKPKWWKVANMVEGPSGVYTQPGADGQQAYDWLQAGAKLAVVPEELSFVHC